VAELFAVEKPRRTPAIERRQLRRAARQVELGRASAKRRRNYGGSPWLRFKRAVLERDGYRCLVRDVGCFGRAQTAHHIKTVGSGMTNQMEHALSVCHWCHARLDDGLIPRERLYAVLSERYGYLYG
jgi:hypothetical protein